MKAITANEAGTLGFQIAPMIDVVFVIMLFFMVMAGSVKVERQLGITLPSGIAAPDDLDEVILAVNEDGSVLMNEEEMSANADGKLTALTSSLSRLKQDADARGSKVIATIQTEEQARYQRVMDVMASLSKAGISDVTFTVGQQD